MDDDTDLIIGNSGKDGSELKCSSDSLDKRSKANTIIGNLKSALTSSTEHVERKTRTSPRQEKRELIHDSVKLDDGTDKVNDRPTNQQSPNSDAEYKRLVTQAVSLDDQFEDTTIVVDPPLKRLCTNPTLRKNMKVYIASLILTLAGLAFVTAGVVLGAFSGFLGDIKSIIFIVGGSLLLIPGGYHFIYMTCAGMGTRGFKFTRLPTTRS